jgi:hypothetical protein
MFACRCRLPHLRELSAFPRKPERGHPHAQHATGDLTKTATLSLTAAGVVFEEPNDDVISFRPEGTCSTARMLSSMATSAPPSRQFASLGTTLGPRYARPCTTCASLNVSHGHILATRALSCGNALPLLIGVKWFRTLSSVGPMLAMKRFVGTPRSLRRSKMAPEVIVIHRQRSGINPERGAGLFERLRRHSIILLTRAGGS